MAQQSKGGKLLNSVPLSMLLKSKDVLFAFGVVLIVLTLIIPLPSFLLDMLLTLNIAVSLTPEQKAIFDDENPFWKDFFSDRQ